VLAYWDLIRQWEQNGYSALVGSEKMVQPNQLPPQNIPYRISFPNGESAVAIRVATDCDPNLVLRAFRFSHLYPAIFISGGAGGMSEEDIHRIHHIMAEVARFAQEQGACIVDGGTESGVMQMIGDARLQAKHTFPLIGVAPIHKIAYPGFANPEEEAQLEDSHTHFVLVDGDDWGDESAVILRLTRTISGKGKLPALGILINGGRVALHDVYMASTAELKLPMLILEGSGRAADEISTAFRTGRTQRDILKAILAGGDIELVAADEGPGAIRQKLAARFSR
jgi:hypothetical protein